MNQIFMVNKKHTCKVPLAMREELTKKGVIPKEVDPDDMKLVVLGAGWWCIVWYDEQNKYTYTPYAGTVSKEKI